VTREPALARVAVVRVGSLNEPKIEAVRSALAAYAPAARVEGVAVASGVPEQPVGWEEIVSGARNRARAARETGACDLSVGIEDGLVELALACSSREVLNVGCAFVTDGERESIGMSSAFAYPPECVAPALDDRAPIGDVFDPVFRASGRGEPGTGGGDELPSGRTMGNIGKLSLGVLPRSDYEKHAVLCALVRFLHPTLYDREPR
jgi:inosine/xanthosine triphosphatase